MLASQRKRAGATAARGLSSWARSQLLAPTSKEAPAQAVARSHELLVRGGFVRQSAAGVYQLLPLAERVLCRIEALIDRELQRAPLAAQKLRLPLLTPSELWQASGRWEAYGEELMRLQDRRGADFCLGPTYEEEITSLVASYGPRRPSELPLKLYQVSSKFRDELRPRFGLLRGREFIMKDMYSFHADRACAEETYAQVCDAYTRIFNSLGLDFVKVLADSGAMGGNYTHEFQVLADVGEDDLVMCDRGDFRANIEVAAGPGGGPVPTHCQDASCSCATGPERGVLVPRQGIEVAQAFVLGTHYSEAFNCMTEEAGGKARRPMVMCCFGIGVSRLMAAVIENAGGSDASGIVWPEAVAPFQLALLTGPGNAGKRAEYQRLAEDLRARLDQARPDLEVLLDDRWGDSFGKKLADAKLMGIPRIAVIGKHVAAGKGVELIDRASGEARFVPLDDLIAQL